MTTSSIALVRRAACQTLRPETQAPDRSTLPTHHTSSVSGKSLGRPPIMTGWPHLRLPRDSSSPSLEGSFSEVFPSPSGSGVASAESMCGTMALETPAPRMSGTRSGVSSGSLRVPPTPPRAPRPSSSPGGSGFPTTSPCVDGRHGGCRSQLLAFPGLSWRQGWRHHMWSPGLLRLPRIGGGLDGLGHCLAD
jgi:hypothetical protein